MCHLPKESDPRLLVGIATSDDASVYQIDENMAIIQTIDFFTPIVDDPYDFGQIAAANALSDVYAMGGHPKLAMNIICFPLDLPKEVVQDILKGGSDKVTEAGAIITGGHTVEDKEPKYGLSVTGFINPKDVLANSTAKIGDVLVLTKPIGIGIITTGIKADMVDTQNQELAIHTMKTLNKYAMEAMTKVGAHSCTDVTGFGLIGHANEMAKGSHVTVELNVKDILVLPQAIELAEMGIIPAGAYNNKSYLESKTFVSDDIDEAMLDCMYDPQTSGGLLIALSEDKVDELLELLKDTPNAFSVVGRVLEKSEFSVVVR